MKSISGFLRKAAMLGGALAALATGGCGGGGDEAPVTPAATLTTSVPAPAASAVGAEGIWKETPISGSSAANFFLIEPDGQWWGASVVRTPSAQSTSIDTFTQAFKGSVSISGSTLAGSFQDFGPYSCGLIYTCRFSGLLGTGQITLSGSQSLGGSTLPAIFNFSGTREASYSTAASFSQVAKDWSMVANLKTSFSAQGVLQISSSGAVSAANIGGCAFAGQLTPVAGKGYFKLALSSVSGSCSAGVVAAQSSGVVFKTAAEGTRPALLHVMWHNPSLSQFVWAAGT